MMSPIDITGSRAALVRLPGEESMNIL